VKYGQPRILADSLRARDAGRGMGHEAITVDNVEHIANDWIRRDIDLIKSVI
jgi:hypothetical protein